MSSSEQEDSDDNSFSKIRENPTHYGYQDLRQALDNPSALEDDDDETEYPKIVEQKRRLDYGDMHDESESVISSTSSDGAQSTPSYSSCKLFTIHYLNYPVIQPD